jgi:hypothetical protein
VLEVGSKQVFGRFAVTPFAAAAARTSRWRSGDAVDVNGVTFSGEQLLSYATAKKRLADKPVFKAMPAPWQPRWRAWLTGFDGTAKLAGDAATGSAALSHNVGCRSRSRSGRRR